MDVVEARQDGGPAQRFDTIGGDAVEFLVEADDAAGEDTDLRRPRPRGVEGVGVEIGEDRVDVHAVTFAAMVV